MLEPYRGRKLRARAALRKVLSGYIGLPSDAVPLSYGPFGKPLFVPDINLPILEFNLATSGDYCLIAVSPTAQVGIDIERIGLVREPEQLAHRFFSVSEAEALDARDGADDRDFLRYWTAKEACLKGSGVGLSIPLAAITVPSAILHHEIVTLLDHRRVIWSLIRVDVGAKMIASLAVRSSATRLVLRNRTLRSDQQLT